MSRDPQTLAAMQSQAKAMERIADAAERLAARSGLLVAIAEQLAREYGRPPVPVFVAVPSDAKPAALKELARELSEHMKRGQDGE